MSFLAALTDTVLLCSYPSRTAAERNNPLISFLCLSLPPLHLCNVSHLCTDSVSTLPSFWRPLFPSCLVPHLALVWYFSLLTYLVFLISLHFFFKKQILLCCLLCNKSIQKHIWHDMHCNLMLVVCWAYFCHANWYCLISYSIFAISVCQFLSSLTFQLQSLQHRYLPLALCLVSI